MTLFLGHWFLLNFSLVLEVSLNVYLFLHLSCSLERGHTRLCRSRTTKRYITETLSFGHALTPYVLKPVNVRAKTTETEKHAHRDTQARVRDFRSEVGVCRRCLPPYRVKWCGIVLEQSDTLLGTCANSTAHLSSVTGCCLIAIDHSPSPHTHTHLC